MKRSLRIFIACLMLACGAASAADRVARVQIVFDGLTAVSERVAREVLYDQIEELENAGLTPASADDTAFFLELFLRTNGFNDAYVDYETKGDTLLLKVQEGERLTIKSVTYEGAEAFPKSQLDGFLLGPIRERHSSFRGALPFVEGLLDEGAGLLQRFYFDQGYNEVVVEPLEFNAVDGNQMEVIARITEGPLFLFGDVEFSGELIYPINELLAHLKPRLADPYSPAREEALARRLQAFYEERGYFDANVTVEPLVLAPGETRVPVRLNVVPGLRFRVVKVQAKGTEKLSPRLIESRFDRFIGRNYRPRRIDKTYRDLLQTGLFRRLSVTPVQVGPDEIMLNIEVEEGQTKEFGVYGGYGSFDGFILGGTWQDLSLLNSGRPVRLNAEATGRGFRGDITLSDPWFLGTELNALARAYYAQRALDDYSKNELGGRAALSWQYRNRLDLTIQLLPRNVEIFDTTLPLNQTGPTSYFINSLGMAMAYDTRDSRFDPTKGWVVGLSLDYATPGLGSDLEFLRGNVRAAYFISMGRVIFSFAMQAGTQVALGDTSIIPIDERYFSGGGTTVRSFGERELSPRDALARAVGGNTTTVFNAEATFPLYQEFRGAVFFDAGNVLQGTSPFDLRDLRYAVGLGLRLNLPIGSLRMDYGINPNPTATEAFGALHFGFGFLF